MELGNIVFGNSRGEIHLQRGVGFEDEWERLVERMGIDYYGENFENKTFAILPYWWGDCTCGFDEAANFQGKHGFECYQTKLDEERVKAGWHYGKYGFLGRPEGLSYTECAKIEDTIYKKLTKKFGLSRYGCAVHCTCDYEDRYLAYIKTIGYADGHKSDCKLVLPNFCYKPTDFQIQWYKYPFRDSYTNQEITVEQFAEIIDKCIDSVGEL